MNFGMQFIHYGSMAFDRGRFQPIKNGHLPSKPSGGLWASPINSTWGWRDWCATECFDCDDANSFTFRLLLSAEVLVINCVDDMLQLPVTRWFTDLVMVDFEKLARTWDAVWLTERGQAATRFRAHNCGFDLYGWDCESILVMNPDVIVTE